MNDMSDLDRLAGLIHEISLLKEQVRQLKRQHLQFITIVTYGLGGELRVTPQDYINVLPGTSLYVSIDLQTQDTVFRTQVPDPPVHNHH